MKIYTRNLKKSVEISMFDTVVHNGKEYSFTEWLMRDPEIKKTTKAIEKIMTANYKRLR